MQSDKFQNKYRIPSTRLKSWDYRADGLYYITTNAKYGENYFGDVVNGKMKLSHIGIIADVLWCEIEHHFNNIKLGEFVVMPNHVHGIIILNGDDKTDGNVDKNNDNNDDIGVGSHGGNDGGNDGRDDACIVSTGSESKSEIIKPKNEQMAKISPKSGSVARIIGSYKSAVSKHAHRLGFAFEWQSRFYDHIIRDEQSFERITNYIINNPKNWGKDKFYGVNKKDG